MNLFSKDEQNAIKAVVKGSSLDPLLTLMAKFNPQRSQIMAGGAFAGSITKPEIAIPIYEQFVSKMQTLLETKIHTGKFGADMKVQLINDGPVTIIIDSKNKV
jgi:D-tyrosyl-tRNA(Tyr) deacylase